MMLRHSLHALSTFKSFPTGMDDIIKFKSRFITLPKSEIKHYDWMWQFYPIRVHYCKVE